MVTIFRVHPRREDPLFVVVTEGVPCGDAELCKLPYGEVVILVEGRGCIGKCIAVHAVLLGYRNFTNSLLTWG